MHEVPFHLLDLSRPQTFVVLFLVFVCFILVWFQFFVSVPSEIESSLSSRSFQARTLFVHFSTQDGDQLLVGVQCVRLLLLEVARGTREDTSGQTRPDLCFSTPFTSPRR